MRSVQIARRLILFSNSISTQQAGQKLEGSLVSWESIGSDIGGIPPVKSVNVDMLKYEMVLL